MFATKRINLKLRLILVVSWVWLGSLIALAQAGGGGQQRPPGAGGAGNHSLRGKVFLPSGQSPELRVRVVLEVATGGIFGETFTDSAGNFEFRMISSGNYVLNVPADLTQLFEAYTERIEISGALSRVFTAQVYLRPRARDQRDQISKELLTVADMQEVPKAAKQHYEKALKHAQNQQPQAAIEKLQEAVKIFPDYLYALNKLGEQYLQSGQRELAQAHFERALAANERFALPHIGLGTMLNEAKHYAEAIAHLEAAIKLDDSYPVTQIQLGLALMENAPPAYERAEKALLRGLALGGKGVAFVYLHLFNLHMRQKHYAQSATVLETFLREAPNAPEVPQVRQKLDSLKKIIDQAASSKSQ
jgi:tetratricopeptide (TPR) repeat protein